jgi:hypothetical protein
MTSATDVDTVIVDQSVLAGWRCQVNAPGEPTPPPERESRFLALVENRGRPERDAGGVTWIDGVIFDVTDRKQAELELVQQRARLIALMDNIPDHIYFKDRESRFTMISKAMATSFGLASPGPCTDAVRSGPGISSSSATASRRSPAIERATSSRPVPSSTPFSRCPKTCPPSRTRSGAR